MFENDRKKWLQNHINSNILTFDIFDTLLIRNTVKPTDVFAGIRDDIT